jgi:FKBP-type peptidyl-prolyl cis-trans isomerase FkpA
MRLIPVLLLASSMLVACDSPLDPYRFEDTERISYSPALGIDLASMTRTPSGIFYQDIRVGSGEPPANGRTIAVHYTGWLPDGTRFDTSRGRGPIVYPHGTGYVIEGWDQTLATMRVGGLRKVVLPPALGYGSFPPAGSVIPPNATLVFEIELMEIR